MTGVGMTFLAATDRLRRLAAAVLFGCLLATGPVFAEDSGAVPAVFTADAVRDYALITSYWTAGETLCAGLKVPVYDRRGAFLGSFREGFLRAVRLQGWGRGDGDGNDGRYLGFYRARGYYLHAYPLDSRGGELVPWRTAASNSLPRGTRVRILALPEDLPRFPEVRQRLLTTEFVVLDRGSGLREHQLDLYVGDQAQADQFRAPEALYIPGACLALDYPD